MITRPVFYTQHIHMHTFHPGGIWPPRHRPGYVGHDRDTYNYSHQNFVSLRESGLKVPELLSCFRKLFIAFFLRNSY